MLSVLLCRCHNSEPLARKTLRESHYENWQSQPVIKGKEACLNFLDTLPMNKEISHLKDYIRRSSSWSVIIGTDGENYEWADVGHGKIVDKLDAERIVEQYGT